MRRFSLIGRLGRRDNGRVDPIQGDSAVFEIHLAEQDGELRFGIGHALRSLSSLGLRPPAAAVDLVVLATLVTAGDTRVSRSRNGQDGWTREIDLYVPVADPELWTAAAPDVEYLLKFLTGDRWRVVFRARPRGVSLIVSGAGRVRATRVDEVSLLSGGLDSFIGAIDLLSARRRPLFVSHYWDGETASAQSRVVDALKRRFGDEDVRSVRVRVGFDRNNLPTGEKEDTQRGRSFLFYSLAALCAASLGQEGAQVKIPENGLIALNVPADPLRLGPLSTRTAHPHFIARMGYFLERIGVSVELVNPYRHSTKGEMVEVCRDGAFLQAEVGNSMSCSSPAKVRYLEMSPRHCGYCVPCLIRRASLKKGLGISDPTDYAIPDLHARPLRTDRAEGEDLRSLQLLAKRIVERPELAKILVHKPGPLIDAPEEVVAYADVFRRGMLEVSDLLDGVTARPG